MRTLAIFFATISTIICGEHAATAQKSRAVHVQNEPGVLETFLTTNPNATVTRQVLGSVAGSDGSRADFKAVVAENKLSKKKVKGIEVNLENPSQKAYLYIDEDGLQELEASLNSLEGTEHFILQHRDRYGSADLRVPHLTTAVNQSPINGESYGVLELGFYQHESGFGVYFFAPPGKSHSSAQLWLQNVDIGQITLLIRSGRAFLTVN